MNDEDREKLLEEGLWGDSPGEVFRARVLLNSTAAFVGARRNHARFRFAALVAAAVLVAGVSFGLGWYSRPTGAVQPVAVAASAMMKGEGVAVSTDLVAWLDAARLFRQLDMKDRMARAIDHAHRLLPDRAVETEGGTMASSSGSDCDARLLSLELRPVSFESMNRIVAQSLGGRDYAEGME